MNTLWALVGRPHSPKTPPAIDSRLADDLGGLNEPLGISEPSLRHPSLAPNEGDGELRVLIESRGDPDGFDSDSPVLATAFTSLLGFGSDLIGHAFPVRGPGHLDLTSSELYSLLPTWGQILDVPNENINTPWQLQYVGCIYSAPPTLPRVTRRLNHVLRRYNYNNTGTPLVLVFRVKFQWATQTSESHAAEFPSPGSLVYLGISRDTRQDVPTYNQLFETLYPHILYELNNGQHWRSRQQVPPPIVLTGSDVPSDDEILGLSNSEVILLDELRSDDQDSYPNINEVFESRGETGSQQENSKIPEENPNMSLAQDSELYPGLCVNLCEESRLKRTLSASEFSLDTISNRDLERPLIAILFCPSWVSMEVSPHELNSSDFKTDNAQISALTKFLGKLRARFEPSQLDFLRICFLDNRDLSTYLQRFAVIDPFIESNQLDLRSIPFLSKCETDLDYDHGFCFLLSSKSTATRHDFTSPNAHSTGYPSPACYRKNTWANGLLKTEDGMEEMLAYLQEMQETKQVPKNSPDHLLSNLFRPDPLRVDYTSKTLSPDPQSLNLSFECVSWWANVSSFLLFRLWILILRTMGPLCRARFTNVFRPCLRMITPGSRAFRLQDGSLERMFRIL